MYVYHINNNIFTECMYLHEDVEDHFHESSLTSYKPKGKEDNIDIMIYLREVYVH